MIAKFNVSLTVFRTALVALITLLLGVGLFAPTAQTFAQEDIPPTVTPSGTTVRTLGEQTVTGSNFVLNTREKIAGDLFVLGGSAQVKTGSEVDGDVNVFGGSVDIAGSVTGDINVLGGSVTLRKGATVKGSTHIFGGSIDREEGITVGKSSGSQETKTDITHPETAQTPDTDWQSVWAVTSGILFVASLILLVLVSISVIKLVPDKTSRMLNTARSEWRLSGGIGLLSALAMIIMIGLFTVTLCLIPLAAILGLALIAGSLIGIAVIARYVGERVMIGLGKQNWTPGQIASVGAITIALVGGIPVLGMLVYIVITSIGFGSLILTRFGTRPYPYLNQLPS